MAFDKQYLGRVNTSANGQALKVWTYNGTSSGSNETVATIVASGYFNSFQQKLTSGSEFGPFAVGDVMHVHGNDANGMYVIDSITTNVTLTSYAAVGTIDTANLADGAVTTAKINDGAVTTAKLADDNVTNAKLAEDTVQYAEVSVSSAELLALRATPKELVAAPGADKVLMFLGAELILDYNSSGYTESSDNMAVKFENGSGVAVSETIESTGFIDQTADTLTNAVPKADAIVAATGAVNKSLVLHNTGDGEFAAGDSPMRVKVHYKVITAGL